ncbi:MAG TPA: peptidylprolyl isomerase [Polyangiaceae bacterium]|nr:peptidylprolyl isomerase [Polyangiaceae bacterium]
MAILREPTLHFFAIAALALLGQRLFVGDGRTIEVTPVLEADLLRRYQDQLSRPPTSAEAAAFMAGWKLDEALYREALREGLDRDDPTVRTLLINKLRDRLLLQSRLPEPSEADLSQYLEQHRGDFEAPLIYEHEFVAFAKQAGAEQERARYEAQLRGGATPSALGLRSTVANVNRERMVQEFGPEVADQIAKLTPGQWQELETSDRLLLVKLNRVEGGLPPADVLHAQLLAGWKGAQAQTAVLQAAQTIAARYRFEEKPR